MSKKKRKRAWKRKSESAKRRATLSTPAIFWDNVTQFRGEWHEGCQFVPVQTGGAYPSFVFSVKFQDAGTREAKTRTTITLTADGQVWDYVMRHPYWRIDPRPLFLESIREVLWNLKLVSASFGKPAIIKTGVKFRQGGTIYMLLTAEVFVETGGSTIFLLANWTNQHIPDQLKAVYEQNPDAKPPQSHCDTVIADFRTDMAQRERELCETQRKNLSARGKNPMALSAFIDESGDIGFRTPAFSYVLSATVFPDSEVAAVRGDVTTLIDDTWRKQHRPSEIHFSKLSETKRSAIITGLSQIVSAHDGRILLLDCRKDNFLAYLLRCEAEHRPTEERPIITQWPDVLDDPDGQCNRTLLVLATEELVCHLAVGLLDSGGLLSITHDKKFRAWMNDALDEGFARSKRSIAMISEHRYGTEVALPLAFRLEHSENEPCLWFSDWIAWETARWLRGEDTSKGFEACVPRMTYISFDDSGRKLRGDRLGGIAIGEYPDVPRDIQSLVLPAAKKPKDSEPCPLQSS